MKPKNTDNVNELDKEIGNKLIDCNLALYSLLDNHKIFHRIEDVLGRKTVLKLQKNMIGIGTIQWNFNKKTKQNGWCH